MSLKAPAQELRSGLLPCLLPPQTPAPWGAPAPGASPSALSHCTGSASICSQRSRDTAPKDRNLRVMHSQCRADRGPACAPWTGYVQMCIWVLMCSAGHACIAKVCQYVHMCAGLCPAGLARVITCITLGLLEGRMEADEAEPGMGSASWGALRGVPVQRSPSPGSGGGLARDIQCLPGQNWCSRRPARTCGGLGPV